MLKINTSYCSNHQHSNIKNGVIDPKDRDTNDTKVEPNDTNEDPEKSASNTRGDCERSGGISFHCQAHHAQPSKER